MNNTEETGVFHSPDQAKKILTVLLKYFSKDTGDHIDLPEYLISKITVTEVSEKEGISVNAEFRSATLNINVPVSPYMTREEIEQRKLEALVSFSSMLDKMKTKTLVEIYRSLKGEGQAALNSESRNLNP